MKKVKESPRRSRSPLKRSVQFAEPLEHDMDAKSSDPQSGMMRMKTARDAVPRKEGESRQAWKNRIFNYKRLEESKHAQEEKKRPARGK